MSNWGDEFDEELKRDEKIEVGLMFSFKSMSHIIDRIINETREWDEKHPKKDLMKIWINVMIVFMVLFTFTYSVLAVATVVFYFFYGYVIIQLYGAWKRFKYSKGQYWCMTMITLIVLFVITTVIRGYIFRS